jgi:uncharacterized membrane protein
MIHIKRHIAKTVSYRILGSLTTVVISYAVTQNIEISSLLGFSEILVKPVIYFFHERAWYKWITFGVKKEN